MITLLKKKLKIDDALDAFGCHGIGGVWGGIATGLFGKSSINSVARWDGLFFGDYHLFVAQLIGIVVTIAVAVLSLIMIYFTIKSNAMARSEELTVYRLIGISPGSILKAYMLEMVMMTAYTCIPAILITSGVIKFITSIPSLEIYLLFPWWMAALLILAMFTVNIIVSILPVRKILHTPPAQLVQ